ncbi:PREDICTED: interleukin-15 receptor subunit alpha, partial [Cariama cristata]|uniref:interleukin-15 receptor subunit alpha n=1 Tax=Cariama cristata TaxID=54380 RepID=UPI0005200110
LLPLLYGTVALLLPWADTDTVPVRCSRPKDVANARIDVGNNTLLNTRLRYTCNPGYKRKAGTSSLIQCILRDGSTEPDWTHTTLQCIRDPALRSQTPSPELPTALHAERTTQRVSIQTLAPSIAAPSAVHWKMLIGCHVSPPGLPVLVITSVVVCCCWRMKKRAGQSYVVGAIPMVALASENEEMLPSSIFPMG